MALDNLTLTAADIKKSNWEACLSESAERKCSSYVLVLSEYRNKSAKTGDSKQEAVFHLFATLASLSLRSDNPNEPFAHFMSGPGWRSLHIEDIPSEHLDLLTETYENITDAEMRARVADVLWVSKRNHKAAQSSVVSYLEAATAIETEEYWPDTFARIERATRLAFSIGGDSKNKTIAFIESSLENSAKTEVVSLSAAKLMSLLLEIRQGDSSKYAVLSELHGQRSIAEKNWPLARRYFDLAAQWLHRCKSKDESAVRSMRLRSAELFVQEAEEATGRSYAVASHHLSRAIEALRRAKADPARVNELHQQLIDYQKKSMRELKEVSTTFDATDIAARARACVQGKSLSEAILSLCVLARPPKVSDLRKQVIENSNNFLYMKLFPGSIVSHEGKVIASQEPIPFGDVSEDDDAVKSRMYAEANAYRHITISGTIEPARREIWNNHQVNISDMLNIVTDNPFVPSGREYIFARGLQAGFSGDFVLSLHLLIPQIENSIRQLMAARGVIVSTLVKGIQQEKDLNVLLYDPEADILFCEDLLFELRGLLISRFGMNLRNLMAHGLLSSDACYSSQSAYFWWMTLRLVCHPYLVSTKENPTSTDSINSDEPKEQPSDEAED